MQAKKKKEQLYVRLQTAVNGNPIHPIAQAQTLWVILVASLSLSHHIHGQQGSWQDLQNTHPTLPCLLLITAPAQVTSHRVPAKAELISLLLSLQPAMLFPFWFSWNCLTITKILSWVMASRARKCQKMTLVSLPFGLWHYSLMRDLDLQKPIILCTQWGPF